MMRTPLAIVSLAAALLGASLPWPAGAADAPAAASAPATAAPASPAATAAATGPTDTGILGSPEQRARYHRLAEELRCLVCQNQTLADSNAELAADLRHQVENQILAGRSDDEIKAYLVQRYGDFVLYRPPFKASTALLWLGPFVLLALGAWLYFRRVRLRKSEPPASKAERSRAAKLLE